MESNQIKLLLELAKKIKSEKKDKEKVIASLQSAKILTPSVNFTVHYNSLKKVFVDTK